MKNLSNYVEIENDINLILKQLRETMFLKSLIEIKNHKENEILQIAINTINFHLRKINNINKRLLNELKEIE